MIKSKPAMPMMGNNRIVAHPATFQEANIKEVEKTTKAAIALSRRGQGRAMTRSSTKVLGGKTARAVNKSKEKE